MTLLDAAPRVKPTRRRFLLAAVGLVSVVALLVAYQLWWSKPTAFAGWGNLVDGSAKVGQTLTVDMGSTYPGENVTLHSARPVVRENSANARIQLVVCHYKPGDHLLAVLEPIENYCSSTSPIDGFHLATTTRDDESILARITPRQAGRVRLDGMTISYSRGWQHAWQTGSEQAGMGVRVHVK